MSISRLTTTWPLQRTVRMTFTYCSQLTCDEGSTKSSVSLRGDGQDFTKRKDRIRCSSFPLKKVSLGERVREHSTRRDRRILDSQTTRFFEALGNLPPTLIATPCKRPRKERPIAAPVTDLAATVPATGTGHAPVEVLSSSSSSELIVPPARRHLVPPAAEHGR